jgi:hypothetical protein
MMKKSYQRPLADILLMNTEPLLALSQKGTKLVIDPTEITEEDAGGAASRYKDNWEDDDEEDV